ncbi:hypothetical protein GWI33_015835 [Rhynchophorus ferrugineus]|uniref:Uncharacterized protein n=1 Tax=Rhynchophorus ferrugineus TaxID=354439 RepID=A0A834I4M1_RHYFE|nr:hypothetical protein GWI33_015835 [Rhynchophorus ferrugineus]
MNVSLQNRCQQYQNTIARLNLEITTLRQQLEERSHENHPEGFLQAHTAVLKRHAEESRKHYEKCLDDVANQVVKAILAQKGLREEVGKSKSKIQELESQNQALTSMLVHQLRGENPGSPGDLEAFSKQLSIQCQNKGQDLSPDTSPSMLLSTSLTTKHCNSFNSEILEESPGSESCEFSVSETDKRLSADGVNILETKFSLEDKKRHQVLTKLWTELKGTEVTPKKLLEALGAIDSALWVPPKRPVSLNLQLPILQTRLKRTRPILAQSNSKSEEETTGNESPESGNRDEGYSTMSSDVQADVTRASNAATLPHRSLEDLKEASDETDLSSDNRQISISTLPSIQENNALELEEDSNECLWNNSSYMMDKAGRELVTLLMDSPNGDKQWPYAVSSSGRQQISPDNSWSSGASDCCHSHEPETCSKRSSAASDDTGELPQIGTDFTRDFYRLVKFESTKSLASTSSRSIGGALSEVGDRDAALQNVLIQNFIAEQQKFVHSKDRPRSVNDIAKDFSIEVLEDAKNHENEHGIPKSDSKLSDDENYVTLKQLCEAYEQKEKEKQASGLSDKLSYAEEVCVASQLDIESENCSNIGDRPVDICSSVDVELTTLDYQSSLIENNEASDKNPSADPTVNSDRVGLTNSELIRSTDTNCSDVSANNCTSESLTSSVSTPETVVSKIPRRKTPSRIPVSPARVILNNNNNNNNNRDSLQETKIPKSKIPHKSNKPKPKKIVHVHQNNQPQHIITAEKLPQSTSGVISNIIEGPPHRAVSFHERATSKDVIDELNRMIKNGDESSVAVEANETAPNPKLDQACRPTGWIHVEKDIDLTDPKARANLLDVMMASVSSDSSPTSSCGDSIASDSPDDPPDYGHLHKIHKYHRQKKASASAPCTPLTETTVASAPPSRPTIIGRPDFFVRYGDKEKEAVASFDFLNDFSSDTSSLSCSVEGSLEEIEDIPETDASTSRTIKISQV